MTSSLAPDGIDDTASDGSSSVVRLEERRWVRFATLATVAASLVFALREATLGAHSDDRLILSELEGASYGDVLRAPFFQAFYRPLVLLVIKLGADFVGDAVRSTRVLHAFLLLAVVFAFRSVVAKRARPFAAAVGVLFVLGSPNTFVSVLPFAVGLSDLIVALCFIGAVATTRPTDRASATTLVVLAVVAALSKETGLLVALHSAVVFAQRRRFGACAAFVLGMVAFVVIRSVLVPHVDFIFGSGYLTEYLDVTEVRSRFGPSPGSYYAYNVAATFVSSLTSEPSRGYFDAAYTDLALIPLATSATLLVVRMLVRTGSWRNEHLGLVVVVVANAAFGYSYVRPRIVFVATVAMSLLLASSIDVALHHDERPFGISAAAWSRWLFGLATLVLLGQVVRVASSG